MVERDGQRGLRGPRGLAQSPDFPGQLAGESRCQRGIVVGHDPDLRPRLRYIAIGKSLSEADAQHAVAALEHLHAFDESDHWLAGRMPEVHHPAVDDSGDGPYAAEGGRQRQAPDLLEAFENVRMRIFLVRDDHVRIRAHLLGEMTVQVEFDADRDVGPDDRPDALDDVALAIGVAVGNHRAVQRQHDGVHRQRGAQILEQFVAQ